MAMYAYDSLLMPTRFWGEKIPNDKERNKKRNWLPQRPPSSSIWILYKIMIRIWKKLFTPAAISVVFGIIFLYWSIFIEINSPLTIVSSVLLLPLFIIIYKLYRPKLGVED